MGEVIQFIPKAERERLRLIREARATYDGVFPSSDSVNAQRDNTAIVHSVNGTSNSSGRRTVVVIDRVAVVDGLNTSRN